ncbi:MAG: hypothetical protein AAF065_13585 [Verrucomicrobiota bacterium]
MKYPELFLRALLFKSRWPLWIRWGGRSEGANEYMQLIITDPLTLEDIFVAETYIDYIWAGVNDQNNFYPLMNALIEYIDLNSESYNKLGLKTP